MRAHAAVALAGVLLLAGCGNVIRDPFSAGQTITLTGNPLADFAPVAQKFAAYAEPDVRAALADAQAQTPPDAVGMSCWSTLLGAMPLLQTPAGAAGAVALQKGRDLQRVMPLVVNACNGLIPFLGVS